MELEVNSNGRGNGFARCDTRSSKLDWRVSHFRLTGHSSKASTGTALQEDRNPSFDECRTFQSEPAE